MFNLNAQIFKELPEGLALAHRGLYYADALFETVRVFDGRIPLLERHWDRLSRGLQRLRYKIPPDWSVSFFEKEILKIAPDNARVRLTVWRAPGGLYLPQNNEPQFLIAAQNLESNMFQWFEAGIQIGLCESVRLPVDTLSGLKALSAARYVAAAQEARERGWDDAIVLNAFDRVCEATSSNVFWLEGNTFCTPPLADGCVTGVLRDLLLTLTRAAGGEILEKQATFDTLLMAREVFLTNAVRGIRWVRNCEGTVYQNTETRKLHEQMVGYLAHKLAE